MSSEDTLINPIQPTYTDDLGTVRFKPNSIVEVIFENCPYNLTDLAKRHFTQTDREQFAQLIGYSVSGFNDLYYASTQTVEAVDRMRQDSDLTSQQARILYLENQLRHLTDLIRDLSVATFQIHPDDLVI
jgi:hypothetical protein